MTTHEHLSTEILADYAEGLLGDADATAAADHLADCDDCRADQALLASVSFILAADDPGPMPAHFAARIDAALADLAAAEPVTPRKAAATAASSPDGAQVIDLASRRRFAGGARVTSIAASLVLVIGGAALGTQVLNSDDTGGDGGSNVADGEVPSISATTDSLRITAYATKAQQKPKGANAIKGKPGSGIDVVDKNDGTVYLKSGKVIFADGTVVVPKKKTGEVEVRQNPIEKARDTDVVRTFQQNQGTQPTTAPESSPAPAVSAAAEPTAPPPTAKASPAPAQAPNIAKANKADVYVAERFDYTPDNFATRVMKLLQESGNVGFSESSVGSPEVTAESTAKGTTDQNRVSAGALRTDTASTVDRGPGSEADQDQVRRCANQLDVKGLLVGEVGTWKKQDATVIVIQNPSDPGGVIGYVIAGNCTAEDRATPDKVLWQQNVDKPAPAEDPKPVEKPAEKPVEKPADTVTRSSEQ